MHFATPNIKSIVSRDAKRTDSRHNYCCDCFPHNETPTGSGSDGDRRNLHNATRWSCLWGSQGSRASLGVRCVDGAQNNDGGGGQNGCQKRPTCLLTRAFWPPTPVVVLEKSMAPDPQALCSMYIESQRLVTHSPGWPQRRPNTTPSAGPIAAMGPRTGRRAHGRDHPGAARRAQSTCGA